MQTTYYYLSRFIKNIFLFLSLINVNVLVSQTSDCQSDQSGCEVTVSADKTSICPGQEVNLSATGGLGVDALMSNTFNDGTIGQGWDVNFPANFGNYCGVLPPNGSNYLWMGNAAANPRVVTTQPYDVSNGGFVSFWFRMARQPAGSTCDPCDSPPLPSSNYCGCEGPDELGEGVSLQYSTDGGTTWEDIIYFCPDGNFYPYNEWAGMGFSGVVAFNCMTTNFTSWNEYCFNIPEAAKTPNTQFRWVQEQVTSANHDHWGLDDVLIATSSQADITWTSIPAGFSHVGPNPPAVSPTETTTYIATISDGVTTCSDQITIVVEDLVLEVSDDVTICQGESTQLTASGAEFYAWTPAEGLDNHLIANPIASPQQTTTYILQGSNANGCTKWEEVTVTVEQNGCCIEDFNFTTTPDNCGANDGSIVLTPNGGSSPYLYSIDNGQNFQNDNTFSGLSAGTYQIVIKDQNDCSVNGSVVVNNIGGPTIVDFEVTQPNCGECDGSIKAIVEGGNLPYTFEWRDEEGNVLNEDTDEISGLCSGNFTLIVSSETSSEEGTIINQNYQLEDGPGGGCGCPTGYICVNDAGQVFDGEHPLYDPATSTGCDVQSTNYTNSLGAYSGNGYVYFYAGLDMLVTEDFYFLEAGTTVEMCVMYAGPQGQGTSFQDTPESFFNFEVRKDGEPTFTPVGANVTVPTNTPWTQYCFEFEITETTTYQFSVSAGGFAPFVFWFDDFKISVKEASSSVCSTSEVVELYDNQSGTVSFSIDDFCGASSESAYDISTPGGVFSFVQTPSDGATINSVTGQISGATGGTTYEVEYTIEGTCPLSVINTVTSKEQLSIDVDAVNPSCGECDGSITAVTTNGLYTYEWYDEQGNALPSTDNNIENLCVGSYSLVVAQNGTETIDGKVILNDNHDFEQGPGGNCDCATGYQCINDAGRVIDGVHPVHSTNAMGCFVENVNYTSPLGAHSGSGYIYFYAGIDELITNPISFQGGEEVDICVFYSGPVAPGPSGQDGQHSYFTFGLDGQRIGDEIPVPTGTGWTQYCMTITMTPGEHTFHIFSGGGAHYAFWFDDFTISMEQEEVIDANTCPAELILVLENDEEQEIEFSMDDFCGSFSSPAYDISIQGGVFELVNVNDGATIDPQSGQISNAQAGASYEVKYSIEGDCPSEHSVTVSSKEGFDFSLTSVDASCGEANGELVLSANGTPPFTFTLNPGNITQPEGTFSNLQAGNYTFSIQDDEGCVVNGSAIVNNADGPNVELSYQEPSCGVCDGSITATVTGGEPPYTFEWRDEEGNILNETGNTLSDLCSGEYVVTITDNPTGNQESSVILNQNYDFELGDDGPCGCPTGYVCENDAGRVVDGIHPLLDPTNIVGCAFQILPSPPADMTSYVNGLGAYSGSASVFFYAGADRISTADAFYFDAGEEVELCVHYSGPQGEGPPGQGGPQSYFTFGALDISVGGFFDPISPQVTIETNTPWTAYCFTYTIPSSGEYRFSINTGGSGQYVFWFDDFKVIKHESSQVDIESCPSTSSVVLVEPDNIPVHFEYDDFCSGEQALPFAITPTGGVFTLNTTDPNASINPQTGQLSNVSSGFSYDITYTPNDICASPLTKTVTVFGIDDFSLAKADASCSINDGVIQIEGLNSNQSITVSYVFNGVDTETLSFVTSADGTIVINNLAPGNYSSIVISTENCSYEYPDVIIINADSAPEITVEQEIVICEGDELVLNASSSDGNVVWNDSQIVNGEPFVIEAPGVYTFEVSAGNESCETSKNVTVTVNPLPNVNAGNSIIVCEGESVVLTANGAVNYEWSHGIQNGVPFVPSSTQLYSVSGVDANGCSATDEVLVSVEQVEPPYFEGDVLSGCEPHTVNFSVFDASNYVNCFWDFGDGTTSESCHNTINTYISAGIYDVSLSVVSENGCVAEVSYQDYIKVSSPPIADFTMSSHVLTIIDSEVQFTNESIGATNYTWNFGDGSPLETTLNASHTYTADGPESFKVTLIAYNDDNCSDTASAVIRLEDEIVFYVPNTFTPDNDQYNQVFKPVFTSGFDPFDYHLIIFNRWGEILFESFDASVGWDGSYGNTKVVKDGTYIWKIEFKETMSDRRHVHTGHVNLLR